MAGDLTAGKVPSKLMTLWLPMIGGVLAVKAIGLSDAYFVGQLGEQPLAAISFTFPIVMTLISLAIGLSAGASSVLSRAIGDNADAERQAGIVMASIVMACFIAIALSLFGFLTIDLILSALGASGTNFENAKSYMLIWFAGSIFLIVPIAINGLLRATGDGISPAILMTAIAALNISLNPIFIFGYGPIEGLGMQGAAVATITARAVSMLGAIALIWHKGLFKLKLSILKSGLSKWKEVAKIGLPASLSTSLNPIALSIATAAVATLGSSEVAAFGVVTKIQSFAVVPLLALSSATAPFIGQNSSAGAIRRSRNSLLWCAGISIAWSIIIAGLLFMGADFILSKFTDSDAVRDAAKLYFMIVPLSYAGYGLIISLSAGLNGLGRSIHALLVSGGRAILLLAPAAFIGVQIGGFTGLAIGTAIANLAAGLMALYVVFKHPLTVHDEESSSYTDGSESD